MSSMNTMNTDFECYVHLYDVKYKITLTNNNKNYLLFCDLYPEIQKIDEKQNVSFEANTYEIFDTEVNRFRRITSFGEKIENQSRVRVLLKPDLFKNYLLDSKSDPKPSLENRDNFGNSCKPFETFERLDRKPYSSQPIANSSQSTGTYVFDNHFNKNSFTQNSNTFIGNDSQCWPQSAQHYSRRPSTLESTSPSIGSAMSPSIGSVMSPSIGSAMSPSIGSLMSPPIVQSVLPPFMAIKPKPTQTETQTYCPKVIDYSVVAMDQKMVEILGREGIEVKHSFNFVIYLCKVCDECLQTSESALKHSQSAEHFANKCGNYSDELDQQLVIPSELISDISVVLARKQELKKLDSITKRRFVGHGIRIKDGIGVNAYVCVECKVSLMSLSYVRHHMQKFEPMTDPEVNTDVVYCSTTFKTNTNSQQNVVNESKKYKGASANSEPAQGGTSKRNRRSRGRKRNRNRDKKEDKKDDKKEDKKEKQTKSQDRNRSEGIVEKNELDQLKKEGILLKDFKQKGEKFICRICDVVMPDRSAALKHMTSNGHLAYKTGEALRGIDRLFVIDCDKDKQMDHIMCRKRVLRNMSFELKEECVYHGIRLKNGNGSNAFVCLTCNQSLDSIKTIEHHLNWLDIHKNINTFDKNSNNSVAMAQNSALDIESLFRNEGLKRDVNSKDAKQNEKLICVFCDHSFANSVKALEHLNRPYHQKTKRGLILKPIDSKFVTHSDRLDEFDISYARMKAILYFTNERKIRYSDEGIRLRDGIGANAYVCFKCNIAISADSCQSAANKLMKHVNSQQHSERLLTTE